MLLLWLSACVTVQAREMGHDDAARLCMYYSRQEQERANALAPVRVWRTFKLKYLTQANSMLYICPGIWIASFLLSVYEYLFQCVSLPPPPLSVHVDDTCVFCVGLAQDLARDEQLFHPVPLSHVCHRHPGRRILQARHR